MAKLKSICKQCGKEFYYYPSEKDGKYCSSECYNASRNKPVKCVCENCGKEFYRRYSLVKEHAFCSNKCRSEKWNNKIKIVCKVCGKIFYKRESITKNYKTECCSSKCRDIARRNRVTRTCKGCGKTFEIKASSTIRKSERGKYCSKECYTEFARGKNSHMYDRGQSFYPYCEKFDEPCKQRVRHFFGDVCLICGSTKEQNRNKRMDVHHVFIEKRACCEDKIDDKDSVRLRLPKEIARFGEPEFSDTELTYIRMMVPLCMSCHTTVHHESNDLPYEETIHRKYFAELIMQKYNGKCSLEKKKRGV